MKLTASFHNRALMITDDFVELKRGWVTVINLSWEEVWHLGRGQRGIKGGYSPLIFWELLIRKNRICVLIVCNCEVCKQPSYRHKSKMLKLQHLSKSMFTLEISLSVEITKCQQQFSVIKSCHKIAPLSLKKFQSPSAYCEIYNSD